MAWIGWLKAVETIGDLVDVGNRVRRATSGARTATAARPEPQQGMTSALGQIETRLTNVLVAALKEAFERDRMRLDLEREQVEADRRRAEQALRLEAERQADERALADRRLAMAGALALWITSAVIAAWLPGMRLPLARVPLGLGWAALLCAIAVPSRHADRSRLASSWPASDSWRSPWCSVCDHGLRPSSLQRRHALHHLREARRTHRR